MSPVFRPESIAGVPWLADLVDIPPDASWPRYMTPVHPDAVGSYGEEAEAWIRENIGIELRWWQRLAQRRQLEHDASGDLVWQSVVESTPRRAGKSVRMRCIAQWRCANADLFGEPQLVMLTGKDLAICLEHHRRSWAWAREQGWLVRQKNGYESIEAGDGSRWLVRGRNSVYGYDVTMGQVDECWDVDPVVVDEGLEPAIEDRSSPQIVLTSTAHRQATSLMRRKIEAALAGMGEDFETLLMLWCAPADVDITDEAAWKAASPHWSPHRRKLIAGKVERALRGEADPEMDDPDPIEGVKAQYLNVWPKPTARRSAGDQVVSEPHWERANSYRPARPVAAAAESWFGSGASVALAATLPDGKVGVSVTGYSDMAGAAAAIGASGATHVLVGKSLVRDPAFAALDPRPVSGTSKWAATGIRQLVDQDLLRHDGGRLLTEQVLALRVTQNPEGARVVSTAPLDAVKACLWAVEAARSVSPPPQVF